MKITILTLGALLLLVGCMPKDAQPVKRQVTSTDQNISKVTTPPPAPKHKGELKEVEDTNYSSAYMYPEDSVKKEKVAKVAKPTQIPLATESGMNKEECVAMISQEKFDKYATMFGSETASIKRCNMIKAMNQ